MYSRSVILPTGAPITTPAICFVLRERKVNVWKSTFPSFVIMYVTIMCSFGVLFSSTYIAVSGDVIIHISCVFSDNCRYKERVYLMISVPVGIVFFVLKDNPSHCAVCWLKFLMFFLSVFTNDSWYCVFPCHITMIESVGVFVRGGVWACVSLFVHISSVTMVQSKKKIDRMRMVFLHIFL